jgi:uncharacterized protein Yka (UPF0111/DUF47 family)
MRLRRLPGHDFFFDQVEQAVASAVDVADLLDELLHHLPDRLELVETIRDRTRAGEVAADKVVALLDETFVSPVEPADALLLAEAIRELIATLGDIGERIASWGLTRPRHEAQRQAQLILAAAKELDQLTRALRTMHADDQIADSCAQHNASAREAGYAGLATLRDEANVHAVVAWADIYDRLGDANALVAKAVRLVRHLIDRNG